MKSNKEGEDVHGTDAEARQLEVLVAVGNALDGARDDAKETQRQRLGVRVVRVSRQLQTILAFALPPSPAHSSPSIHS